MSRRAVREQETQDFLEQNPQLIEYQTRIEVVQMPVIEECDGPEPIPFIEGPMYPPMYGYGGFFVEVTPEDGMSYPAFVADVINVPDQGVGALFVEGGNFGLFAGGYEGQGLVSLSAAGFGVAGSSEFPEEEMMMYGPPALPDGFDSINSNEFLVLEVHNYKGHGPERFDVMDGPMKEPEFMTGGTSLGIDFTATGRGTVQIILVDEDTGQEILQELAFRGGRGGAEGHFEVDMPEGQFEFAAITTTGTLEISVVGIDLGTNFDGGFPFGTA